MFGIACFWRWKTCWNSTLMSLKEPLKGKYTALYLRWTEKYISHYSLLATKALWKRKKETFRQMRSELVFDRFVETPLLKVIASFLKETPVVSILLVILEKVNVCKLFAYFFVWKQTKSYALRGKLFENGSKKCPFSVTNWSKCTLVVMI